MRKRYVIPKIRVDVLRDGKVVDTITRACCYQGVIFSCKYKGCIYPIYPNVFRKKRIHNKPFIVLDVPYELRGESKDQPFAGHDGGQEGADD